MIVTRKMPERYILIKPVGINIQAENGGLFYTALDRSSQKA
jgi:hypothetical protein